MMIKIDAIVREEKFEDVKAALNAIGVNGITVSQVMGCGVQKGSGDRYRGAWKWQCRCFRKSNLKSWYLPKNGNKRPSKPFRRQPLPEKSAMAKSSAMRFAPPRKSVPERPAMTHYRAIINCDG